jgi:UDP-glucuronate decarboxylase
MKGKRCTETPLFYDGRQYKLHIKVARIINAHSPQMHPNDGRVTSKYMVQALPERDITASGD